MTNVSNKGLVLLILMTLALSVFTTVLSHERIGSLSERLSTMQTPTGFATNEQTGTASIELSGSVAIVLNVDTLDWGVGIANQTSGSCTSVTLTTVGTTPATLNPNSCWINTTGNGAIREREDFQIENIGTNDVVITINGTNSTNFFGFGDGTSTNLMWRGAIAEGGACTGLTTAWTEFDDESTYSTVCDSLAWDNSADTINVELNMTFPRSGVTTGLKTANIYFLAENATV